MLYYLQNVSYYYMRVQQTARHEEAQGHAGCCSVLNDIKVYFRLWHGLIDQDSGGGEATKGGWGATEERIAVLGWGGTTQTRKRPS